MESRLACFDFQSSLAIDAGGFAFMAGDVGIETQRGKDALLGLDGCFAEIPCSFLVVYLHRRIAAPGSHGPSAKSSVCCSNREHDTTFFAEHRASHCRLFQVGRSRPRLAPG